MAGEVLDRPEPGIPGAVRGEIAGILEARHLGDVLLAAGPGDSGTNGSIVIDPGQVAGSDTVAARIVQILQGAGQKPMTLQRNAERYADRLVLPTFATAGLAWALSGMVDRLTAVLITDFGTGVRVAPLRMSSSTHDVRNDAARVY